MSLIIKIAGINGYLGQLLLAALQAKGHDVSGISRTCLEIDNAQLSNDIKGSDIVINLAGSTLLKRWTPIYKAEIYNSRVYSSLAIVNAINKLKVEDRPTCLINASAVGLYKTNGIHDDESQEFEDGFLGKLVLNWEKPVKSLPSTVKSYVFRMGVVLGKKSTTIKYLKPIFKAGFGCTLGDGKQAFAFVHETDVVNAYVAAVEGTLEQGTYNLVSPQQINNKEFTHALAASLNRKALFTLPAALLQMTHGKAATVLLNGATVQPTKLLSNDFTFTYPDIKKALEQILKS